MAKRRSALALLDEAFHLLRDAQPKVWLLYVWSAIPLVLFAGAEWQTSSRFESGDALVWHSALLAAFYLLFGFGRSAFARRLQNEVGQQHQASGGLRPLVQKLLLHAVELVVLPCAFLSVVGLPWTLAFFRYALCEPEDIGLRRLIGESAGRASRMYRQGWILALVTGGVAFAVFLNLMVALLIFPELFRAFTGIETPLTNNRGFALNGTTVVVIIGSTLALCEALLLAVSVLVLFYEGAEQSGLDLLVRLRNTREARDQPGNVSPSTKKSGAKAVRRTVVTLLVALGVLIGGSSTPMRGAAPLPTALQAGELDSQVDRVLRDRKYGWARHLQVPGVRQAHNGFLDAIVRPMNRMLDGVRAGFEALERWIGRLMSRERQVPPAASARHTTGISVWLVALLATLAAGGAAAVFIRSFGRQAKRLRVNEEEPSKAIDLKSEELLASALPQEEWLAMAQSYEAEGEMRMAVRALYLAELATLAQREVLGISAFKTNADYKAELGRRSRSEAAVSAFARNGLRYESTWYGVHEASREMISEFVEDLERLREWTHA